MRQLLLNLLKRFPRLKSGLRRLRDLLSPSSSVSSNYVEISLAERESEAVRLADSWKNDNLPERQRALVDGQLKDFRGGARIDVFDVFITALGDAKGVSGGASLLEIGCSSGYYAEVMAIAGLPMVYTGCDYSSSFIALARQIYPDIRFDVEDATGLTYPDKSFDIVVSGCCLLHIPDYGRAIAETSRVAREYVLFHRTPVVYGQPTRYFRKQAYGIETVEIHLSETELKELFVRYGLHLEATYTLHETQDPDNRTIGSASRSYLCRKLPRP